MFSYLRKELLPKLILSVFICAVFFLGDILFFTFNTFDLVLLYGIPILTYSVLRKSSTFKKQLTSDILLNIVLALPISLVTGILAASVSSDAETTRPFDNNTFIYVFVAFYLQLLVIGFATLCLGNILRNTIFKKMPVVIIK